MAVNEVHCVLRFTRFPFGGEGECGEVEALTQPFASHTIVLCLHFSINMLLS